MVAAVDLLRVARRGQRKSSTLLTQFSVKFNFKHLRYLFTKWTFKVITC